MFSGDNVVGHLVPISRPFDRTSDHNRREDADTELEWFECGLPIRGMSVNHKISARDLAFPK
jgi:hypothetical protein